MGICSVKGCKSRTKEARGPRRPQDEGVTFHSFPTKNLALRARWCIAVRGADWQPNRFAKVCSKHFEDRFLDRTGQTCRLKENAMPTLGLDPGQISLANNMIKEEYHADPAMLDPLSDTLMAAGHPTNVAGGSLHQCNHEEVLSPEECNKLMYALDLGDGRKIKLIYSVPKGHCWNLF